ncbi:hypothetical protein ACIOGT_25810 [Streptomyces microflavus]|uniref:hypothetical protein n=1 Tax=Streptomyces microflavus TaxID=1919 RepID=UPI0038232B24
MTVPQDERLSAQDAFGVHRRETADRPFSAAEAQSGGPPFRHSRLGLANDGASEVELTRICGLDTQSAPRSPQMVADGGAVTPSGVTALTYVQHAGVPARHVSTHLSECSYFTETRIHG